MSIKFSTALSLLALSAATIAGGTDNTHALKPGFFVGAGVGISTESVPDHVQIWNASNTTQFADFGEVGLADSHAQAAIRAGYIRPFGSTNTYAWGLDLTYNIIDGHHTNLLNDTEYYQQNNYEVENLTTLMARVYMPVSSNFVIDAGAGGSFVQLGIEGVAGGGTTANVVKNYVAPSVVVGAIYSLPNNWFAAAEYTGTFSPNKNYAMYNPNSNEYNRSKAQVRIGEFLLTLNKTLST